MIHIIPQYPVHFKKRVDGLFGRGGRKGGEGVVVRDPRAKYERKIGAIICSWREQNISIRSGLSMRERIDSPKLSSIITFRYKTLTKYGKPRFAVYWRIRR